MRQRLVTIGTLMLAAGAYYLAEQMAAGSARDGVLMVAGAFITLQRTPIGHRAAKAAAVAGLVLLTGCAALGPMLKSAAVALTPVALDALGEHLAQSPAPISLDTRGVCVAVPDDMQPDEALVAACVGPDARSASAAAAPVLRAAAGRLSAVLDESEAVCVPADGDGFPGAVVVCASPVVE